MNAVLTAADPQAMRTLAARIAGHCRAGDVLVLVGELGAGKTTFTQGLAAGLGIEGPVTSPTFVIAREHPGVAGRPGLTHVDAYRLGSALELDDLDVDTDGNVVVVEWGEGMAEQLGEDRLVVRIERSDDELDDVRVIRLEPRGSHWQAAVHELSSP